MKLPVSAAYAHDEDDSPKVPSATEEQQDVCPRLDHSLLCAFHFKLVLSTVDYNRAGK